MVAGQEDRRGEEEETSTARAAILCYRDRQPPLAFSLVLPAHHHSKHRFHPPLLRLPSRTPTLYRMVFLTSQINFRARLLTANPHKSKLVMYKRTLRTSRLCLLQNLPYLRTHLIPHLPPAALPSPPHQGEILDPLAPLVLLHPATERNSTDCRPELPLPGVVDLSLHLPFPHLDTNLHLCSSKGARTTSGLVQVLQLHWEPQKLLPACRLVWEG